MFLTVREALARLPVKMSERVFRTRLRQLGLCYRYGHQITLSEDHLARFIETLQCPPAGDPTPARGRLTSRGFASAASAKARALARIEEARLARLNGSNGRTGSKKQRKE